MSDYNTIKEQIDDIKEEYFISDGENLDFNPRIEMYFVTDEQITPKYENSVLFVTD